ncbi:MAG: isoprenylcysteine carboxylmethyltransferase family protein [Planctomycetes bacterium]|nr:isoprenylcysteine carboxylmethyltransferase family protein [Planctomycetota bacterium]
MQPLEPSPQPARVRRPWWMLLPPPMLFALPLVVSAQLRGLAPLEMLPREYGLALGIGVLGLALFFIPTAPILFAIHRTTIVPHGTARKLIERGPYRVSRNPMYVGLVVVYLGVTLLLDSAWPLMFLALPVWFTHAKTIPYEERVLEGVFGEEYREYARRVPRWI